MNTKLKHFLDWRKLVCDKPLKDVALAYAVLGLRFKDEITQQDAELTHFAVGYADHVTTELQAEITQLRAKVAELEVENKKFGAVVTVIGAIAHPSYMPLHREIGDADNGTTKLKVCVGATASTPLIKHPDGRIWSLGWGEIIELAVKAFAKEGDSA